MHIISFVVCFCFAEKLEMIFYKIGRIKDPKSINAVCKSIKLMKEIITHAILIIPDTLSLLYSLNMYKIKMTI